MLRLPYQSDRVTQVPGLCFSLINGSGRDNSPARVNTSVFAQLT